MDQETKKKTDSVVVVRKLTPGAQVGPADTTSQNGVDCHAPKRILDVEPVESQDDTVHSLDLSVVADKMVLPSRDLYAGDITRLVATPTFH